MTAQLEEELQCRAKRLRPVLFPSATCPESFVSPWGRGGSGVRVENMAGGVVKRPGGGERKAQVIHYPAGPESPLIRAVSTQPPSCLEGCIL